MLQFFVADLASDAALLKFIHEAADTILNQHPEQADKLIRRWIGDASRFAGV